MAFAQKREDILIGLRAEIAAGQSILATGAGCGLSAKSQERGGSDLIVVYNSGKFRMNGFASTLGNLPVSDANAVVYELGRDSILPIVRNTPVIAGVYGVDPTRDMVKFISSLHELGYSGIINFPTVGRIDGNLRADLNSAGLTFEKEMEIMKIAHDLDMITMAYVFQPEEAAQAAQVGVDILVPHCGLTTGGFIGKDHPITMDEAVRRFELMYEAAKEVKPDILPLAHGGPLADVEDVEWFLSKTRAVGFVAASSIERLPVERAISETAKKFKMIPCRKDVQVTE